MTGVRLTVDLDAAAAIAGMTRAAEVARHPAPLLRQIGVYLVHSTQARFPTARSPAGEAWAPLNPQYALFKTGPGILIGSGMSGGLQGSITSEVVGDTVAWGSNKVSAAVHQFGATIVPVRAKALRFMYGSSVQVRKSVTIPARPYLGLSAEDAEEIAWLTGRYLTKLLQG